MLLAIEDDGVVETPAEDCCCKAEGEELTDEDKDDEVRRRLVSSRAVRKLRMVTNCCLHWRSGGWTKKTVDERKGLEKQMCYVPILLV